MLLTFTFLAQSPLLLGLLYLGLPSRSRILSGTPAEACLCQEQGRNLKTLQPALTPPQCFLLLAHSPHSSLIPEIIEQSEALVWNSLLPEMASMPVLIH